MRTALRKSVRVMAFAAIFLSLMGVAPAQPEDQVGVGRTITVAADETRGDIACFQCFVYVRGTVRGDIADFGGRVAVEGKVTGDVAAFWGDVRLGDSAQVGGDVTALGGVVKRSPGAAVHGDLASFGRGQAIVVLIIALASFVLVLGLVVWLVVWLVRRPGAPQAQPMVRGPDNSA
jgi:cytoskeletal protein CcmA (bactofilin family)